VLVDVAFKIGQIGDAGQQQIVGIDAAGRPRSGDSPIFDKALPG
jgi:hypothetical protein